MNFTKNFKPITIYMNRIEIQHQDHRDDLTLEEMIISKSMNGWILQLYLQLFKKKPSSL
ncbi:hypothetical protein SAMN04488089_1222 [Myroides profundi]|uniref:Uncharacterized protein n=1 Tax=Myroides profundi TaxID=480520 RepID=A0AAJ4W6X0_MYRPR|nr:hypothetical protein SAMN04488089_1222 [Myroides profundi]